MKPFLKLIVIIFIITLSIVTFQSYSKNNFIKEAEAHFQQHCDNDAGEFIYRTVDNVEGLFQMRPRDPRDYFSRLRNGDIPEDPYGHSNFEATMLEGLFLYPHSKNRSYYNYIETIRPPNAGVNYDGRFPKTNLLDEPVVTGDKYWRYRFLYSDGDKGSIYEAIQISELESQYGYTWQEVRNELDKKYGIWGGELIVNELKSNEILGIRRGFFYYNQLSKKISICPKKGYHPTYDFISKVLIPVKAANGGEG